MMQEALPHKRWLPNSTATTNSEASSGGATSKTSVANMVSENAVIVFARRGCCMCHSLKLLLHGLGVNPAIYDVDDQDEAAVVSELSKIISATDGDNNVAPQFPAVFVGGRLFGGLDRVMAAHISGELVPILREARALWL